MSLDFRGIGMAASVVSLVLLVEATAHAGASPENALVIIDPTDADSLYVGNHYKSARNIPDANVLYLRAAAQDYATFVATIQAGFLGTLQQRGVQDHIDYVVLAPVNEFTVAASTNNISNVCQGNPLSKFSITAAFELAQMSTAVLNSSLSATAANSPFGGSVGGVYPSGNSALAFHAQQPYLYGSPSTSSGAQQLYISSMLGYTQGSKPNTVSDLLNMIDRSVSADGSRPAGVFYFMNNLSDAPRNSRACGSYTCGTTPFDYTATAQAINSLGGSTQVPSGVLPPTGASNVIGVMSGFDVADINGADLDLLPGTFADELTSFAAVIDGSQSQTTVASWIAAGASGSAGAVQEPCAYVTKFPSADFHKYYYQGMSLGEAYLRSVEALPFQMLLYGDPLTRPFAYVPSVNLASIPSGVQSGVIAITPIATTTNPGATIASYTLLVDGFKKGTVNPGQSFSLDTRTLSDGRHDLRVLAYDNTAVQNPGRWVGTLDTNNYGRQVQLTAQSVTSGGLTQQFAFSYSASGGPVLEVHLMQNGRTLASAAGATGTLTVFGQNLGAGISNVKADVWYSDGRHALSAPVTMNITSGGTPAGVTPVAYSYSKPVLTSSASVVELPAS